MLLLILLSGTEWSQFTTSPSGFHEATLAGFKCFVVIILSLVYVPSYHGIDCNLPVLLIARESCINKFLLLNNQKCRLYPVTRQETTDTDEPMAEQ